MQMVKAFPGLSCKLYDKHGEISGVFDYDMGGMDGTAINLIGHCHTHVVRAGNFYRLDIYMAARKLHTYYITPLESYMDTLRYNLMPTVTNAPCPQFACEFYSLPFRDMTNVEKLVSGLITEAA